MAEDAIEKAAALLAAVADEVGVVGRDEYDGKKPDMVAEPVVMLFIRHKNLALAALQAACDLDVLVMLVEYTVDKEEVGGVADAEGILYINGRQSCDTRKRDGGELDVGINQFGGHEALMVFDNVFIPWENVFMCGEYEFSGALVERFAGYHRQSYGGCKVGVGDVLIGAAALAADYNGAYKASHLKDKLIEMVHLNETLYACGIACSAEGSKTASGNYIIDLMLANVCKQNVTRLPMKLPVWRKILPGD